MNQPVQKNTLYVGGLAEEVNESILHSAFIPFGDIKDVKTPLDQATQKHRSFGFVTFLEKEDAAAAMDNMDGAELYGRVLTVNYALPERIKGGEQGWAAQPIWADADTWFERQQQEEEMQRIQAENRAAMQAAEELHRKKMAQEREGEKDEEVEGKDDPMARVEAHKRKMNNSEILREKGIRKKLTQQLFPNKLLLSPANLKISTLALMEDRECKNENKKITS